MATTNATITTTNPPMKRISKSWSSGRKAVVYFSHEFALETHSKARDIGVRRTQVMSDPKKRSHTR